MASKNPSKIWLGTGVQNLLRHANGTYYARLYRDGKTSLTSLKTKTRSVAQSRLQELRNQHQQSRPANAQVDLKASFRDFLDAQRAAVERMNHRAKRTRDFYQECLTKIERTWGDPDQPIRRISEVQCEHWAAELRENLCANRFNGCLGQFKQVFALAIKEGVIIGRNPAASIKRMANRPKQLQLPSHEQFRKLVDAMKNAGGRFSVFCAEMVEFLAYSGCRREESENVLWRDCDMQRGRLTLRKTKNSLTRVVPMIPPLKRLLQEILDRRGGDPDPDEAVLKIQECYKALHRACAEIGCPDLSHHDLRHLFATTCIEAGVDIPTVSKWMGHQDGGALAMRVYGHLRDEHSMAQAEKVSFL